MCDLALYLSVILKQLGKNVLIRDMTLTKSLSGTIPMPMGMDRETNIIDHAGIGYTACSYSMTDSPIRDIIAADRGYDTIISLYDEKMVPQTADLLVIVSDERKQRIENLLITLVRADDVFGGIDRLGADRTLVVRNYTGAKENQFDSLEGCLKATAAFLIPVSKTDFKAAVRAEYTTDHAFGGLSADYENALCSIIRTVMGSAVREKELNRAFRYAAAGRA